LTDAGPFNVTLGPRADGNSLAIPGGIRLTSVFPNALKSVQPSVIAFNARIGKVWVDGVEIKGLSSDSQPYKFLVLMANSSTPVSRDEIVNVISPGRQKQDEDTAAQQAKSRARQLIAEAMAAVGRSFDEDPFPAAGRGLYRCTFLSHLR
jgi:hypothetical protein